MRAGIAVTVRYSGARDDEGIVGKEGSQKPQIENSAETGGWRRPDSGNVASAGKRESGIVSFGSSEEFAAWGW